MDEYKRINLLIGTQATLASGQEEGMPGIVSDSAYRLGVYAAGAWRLMALRGGSETFSALSISGLTNGAIPLVSTAGGLLGNSSLSEDAVSVKCAKPLALNGTTLAAWGPAYKPTAMGGASAFVVLTPGGTQSLICNNLYVDAAGDTIALETSTSTRYPCYFALTAAGGISLVTSQTLPIAGTTISDMAPRFGVSRFGQVSQWATELVTSSRYVKITDTTIGPSAEAKASLLNGATTGFAAVTDPAGRWNAVGAKSRTELAGLVSSSANQALVFELYHNGASKGFIAVPARTYGTNTAWRLVIKQTVRVAGADGTVRVLMRFYATADNVNSAASSYTMDATLTGIDLTASHTWDVVCTIPNSASNQITCQDAEKIG